eukprot:gene3873-4834_t
MSSYLRKLGAKVDLGAVAQGVGNFLGGSGEEMDDGGVEVSESPQAQLALGAIGLPVLINVLKEEREDVEMVRGALESLYNAMATERLVPLYAVSALQLDNSVVSGISPCKVNADLFAREKGYVQLLLSLLEEEDFYVRYHTVQLMTEIISKAPQGCLQEAILASPMGVSRLMDMMNEREVIRNQTLLLLSSLSSSHANEEIKKIVVFEGAFERLFHIIKEEGAADGGIVVQDCLELMSNLLRDNSSNQVFFRESSFLAGVPSLLKLHAPVTADTVLPQQKVANLLSGMDLMKVLVATSYPPPDNDTNRIANQSLLMQNGALEELLPLAMQPKSPELSAEALWCIGELVADLPDNQAAFGNAVVEGEMMPMPALNAVLNVALRAEGAAQRRAAEHAFKSYCRKNADGQLMLATTIMPVGGEPAGDEHRSFGGLLVRAITGADGRGDLGAMIRAAVVLQYVLEGNSSCKERVLTIPLELSSAASAVSPDTLLPRCVAHLRAAKAARGEDAVWLQSALLRALVTWLTDCPPAVKEFLEPTAHLPLVVELASSGLGGPSAAGREVAGTTGMAHVRGLACVLLGVCVVFNEAVGASDAATVVDVLINRVGLSDFFQRWEDMQRTSAFECARVLPPTDIYSKEALERDLRKQLSAAEERASAAAGDSAEPAAASGDIEEKLEQAREEAREEGRAAAAAEAESEMNDLLVCLGQEESKVERLRERLEELNEGKLDRAHALIRTQDNEMAELRARNSALAERLISMAKRSTSTAGGSGEEGAAARTGMEEEDLQAAAAVFSDSNKQRVIELEAEVAATKAGVEKDVEKARQE